VAEDRWFVAVLVVGCSVKSEVPASPLADLQYRLVTAPDRETAYSRALELGHWQVEKYLNSEGEEVAWKFVGLRDLHEIRESTLVDGLEIYSQIIHRDPASLVMPKDKLSAFYLEGKGHLTVEELLEGE
jgi:hypothetical protein